MSAAIACDHIAAQLNPYLRMALGGVQTTDCAFEIVGDFVEAPGCYRRLGALCIGGRVIESSGGIAPRGKHIRLPQPPVIGFFRWTDELFCPAEGFVYFDAVSEKRRVYGDGRGGVEIAVFGGPPERRAQIRQLEPEPGVGVALARTVPQRKNIGFASSEVAGVRGPSVISRTVEHKLCFGEPADSFQHREPGPV